MPSNPFLSLPYETALEDLGPDYYDPVAAAEFPHHHLRFRNDQLLPLFYLDPQTVGDEDFVEAFGFFQGVRPFLALRYHGYQFGEYNPRLGDGRGFLYGQVRGMDGQLYDFGTKGSGQTPYSRRADGRLTLKGGVREVLAAEALHRLGVQTSRCLSVVETGESLYRSDEPSPTRASVMIRVSRSHIRFGTFERLHYLQRPDLIQKLLDHVIRVYYPEVSDRTDDPQERYELFYQTLVERVARLVAQWMAAGFCHGVLNTDNMSITGESFDYGPYGFIPRYDPSFTAAYFDYGGRYSYGNQPGICRLNLELLQRPLALAIAAPKLQQALDKFEDYYGHYYQKYLLRKLGLENQLSPINGELLGQTLTLLSQGDVGYHQFFAELRQGFSADWRSHPDLILENRDWKYGGMERWQTLYAQALQSFPPEKMSEVAAGLTQANPLTALLRPAIEAVWEPITEEDDWEPFHALVAKLQRGD